MKNIISFKFPCGYQIYWETNGSLGLFGDAHVHFDDKDMPTCPIHGNKCKKEVK